MEVNSVLSIPYAIVNKSRPVVGPYGPNGHSHTKNHHHPYVSGFSYAPLEAISPSSEVRKGMWYEEHHNFVFTKRHS